MQTDVKPVVDDTLKTRPSLLSKVRREDEDGWDQFYTLYEDFIYAAARGSGLSREAAQDVVQATMVSVRKYIHDFVPDEKRAKFRTWLRKIVRSRIADHYRSENRNALAQLAEHASPTTDDQSGTSTTNRIPNLNETELDRLMDRKLEEAILNQARKQAQSITSMENYQAYDLFIVQEMSAKEVAKTLGIGPVTVRVRAFRAKREVERKARQIVKSLDAGVCVASH